MPNDMTENKHLQWIEIEGYKSIKKAKIDFTPINIIIGANGSGKSNLISIFDFFRALADGRLSKFGSASHVFHFGTKETKKMKVSMKVDKNSYHGTFEESFFGNSIVIDDEYCKIETSDKTYSLEIIVSDSGLAEVDENSNTVQGYTKHYMNSCKVHHFHDTSSSAGFKKPQDAGEHYFLQKDGGNIAPFLYNLKEKNYGVYKDIVQSVQAVAPYFKDFFLEVEEESFGDDTIVLRWKHVDNDDATFTAYHLSDGTARFILMAALFLQPKPPKTIVLDEPELGLHPKALAVLADIIKSVSKTTQVICSTQSVEFANHFEPEDFIVVDQKNGISEFSRPKTEDLEMWLEEYGMGDIWCKNLIGGRP